jgi:hypothetical protein
MGGFVSCLLKTIPCHGNKARVYSTQGVNMPHSFYPDMSKYKRVIDTLSKKDADSYIRLGWKLIETFTESVPIDGQEQTNFIYRIGWLIDAGTPIEPLEKSNPLKRDE